MYDGRLGTSAGGCQTFLGSAEVNLTTSSIHPSLLRNISCIEKKRNEEEKRKKEKGGTALLSDWQRSAEESHVLLKGAAACADILE